MYNYRVFTINVDTPFQDREILFDGRLLYYHTPPSGPELKVKLNSSNNDYFAFAPRTRIRAPYQKFFLTLPTTVLGVHTVELYAANPQDIILESSDVSIDTIASLQQVLNIQNVERVNALETGLVTITDAVTLIRPVNSGRKRLTVYNQGLETVYIGTIGVSSSVGFPLLPGSVYTFRHHTGAVYGRCFAGNQSAIAWIVEGI